MSDRKVQPRTSSASASMALFTLPPALQAAGCMTNGQPTPPPSPHQAYRSVIRSRSQPKGQPLGSGTKRDQTVERAAGVNCSTQHKTVTEMPSGYVQPRDMFLPKRRQPIQSTKLREEDVKPMRTPSISLRRVTHSYDDLRSLALEHGKDRCLTISARSPAHTPLLPSPVVDDYRMEFSEHASVPFKFENPRPQALPTKNSTYQSYDDAQILSCYQDAQATSTYNVNMITQTNTDTLSIPAVGVRGNNETTLESSASWHRQVPSYSSSSSESDWLANTTSQQQRLRRFKARCYQVIQHPIRNNRSTCDEEGEVMLATVLIGPGKPRLVEIQRPTSSSTSYREKTPILSQAAPVVQPMNKALSRSPCTPTYQRKEVSAFSPYDTPSVTVSFTGQSIASYIRTSIEQTPITESKIELVPQPLSISCRNSSNSESTIYSSSRHRMQTLPTSSRDSSYSSEHLDTQSAVAHVPSCDTFSHDVAKPSDRLRMLKNKLDVITSAVNEFPNSALGLRSPGITAIRNLPIESKNEIHLSNLAQVLPDVSDQVLSMLAAWILIDSYLANFQLNQNPGDSSKCKVSGGRPSLPMKLAIPRRSASLGILTKRHVEPLRKPSAYYRLFPTPPSVVTKKRNAIIKYRKKKSNQDRHATKASPNKTSKEMLQSIPDKARSVLGIVSDDEELLMARARTLSSSVGVIAQRLMELTKGQDGWDPYLWRALGVVVQSVERET